MMTYDEVIVCILYICMVFNSLIKKIFYKDGTETKVKVEVRFDINVQRQKFLSDSITIVEEFEKLVRMNKVH